MSRIGREEQRRQAQEAENANARKEGRRPAPIRSGRVNGKTTFYRGPMFDEDEDEVLPRDIEEGR